MIDMADDWPTAKDRILMAIFGPTDADRARLAALTTEEKTMPTPKDVQHAVVKRLAEQRAMELSLERLKNMAHEGKLNYMSIKPRETDASQDA